MMNYEEALSVLRQIETNAVGQRDQEVIAQAIPVLCQKWKETLKGVEMEGVDGAPDWKAYEMRIWQLGESLRPLMRRRRKWRGRGKLLDSVAEVLSDKKYGKGRQTFALLLGDFGGSDYGATLAGVLDQPQVAGHAVKALMAAKVPGHEGAVSHVAEQATGWARSAAKKYLKLYGERSRKNR